MTSGERVGEDRLTVEQYKSVFRQHPAGVAVIATTHQGRPVGFTATSVISVSADPPLLAFSLAATSSSAPAITTADTLTISLLTGTQDHIAARFATTGIDRFATNDWTTLPTGEPIIDNAHAWIRARILERTPVGGSYLISLLALTANTQPETTPLVFHDRTYHRLGPHTAI
ncbi:flavin reductase family protein [Streptomyces profundus]|uniref:flavin reductase family protein n=1 Tax=Streptomyces profundus TaxID=2867410 RepID=UPI001D16EB35|nr:flavin reductase family protein [Streptomyces sp. MA3_2.13]UED86730.1 flavin reductase family protein [Streptomyces sp. MA3_2.13]